VAEACVQAGYSVRAFVRYNSRNAWGWLEGSSHLSGMEIRSGDVRDYDSVFSAMKDCDGVLHLAALIGIPYSYESPLAYLRTNVDGTYNVLQAARELGLQDVVVTSTSETYGTAQRVPIDETHPLVGQSPYSASKIAADQLAISYHCSFGLPVKIVRPFNTFGPRQSARAIIPTIVTQILAGQKEIKLGNLAPTRDLTYVKDTASAFLEILKCPKLVGEVTNVGMGEEITVDALAKKVVKLMGAEVRIVEDKERLRPDKSEVERLLSDNSKLRKATPWTPSFDLERGLQETIAFLREHQSLYKANLYNV
jgi:NAD dependent epimerase/dehydratase